MGKINYDAVCVECEYSMTTARSTMIMCSRPVDIITGKPAPTTCVGSRSKLGHCGPEGRHFVAGDIITGKAAGSKKEVANA